MDPYLEQWTGDVHLSLIVCGTAQLQPRLPRAYVARIDDLRDETFERRASRFVVIRPAGDDGDAGGVISIIDFVRPDRPLAGRAARDARWPDAVLTEIDLFAAGLMQRAGVPARHGAIVTRAGGAQEKRHTFELRRPLPTLRVPLRRGSPDVNLDLQPLVDLAYVNGAYDGDLDYTKPPVPPLAADDEAWADALLRAAGRRG